MDGGATVLRDYHGVGEVGLRASVTLYQHSILIA